MAEPSIGWAYAAADSTIALSVIQDSPRGAYELPMTVVVTEPTVEQRRLEVQIPAQPRAIIALPGRFPNRPASVAFDPDHLLLARIARQ